MEKKGQVGVVGFTLITLILLITVGSAFVWGRSIIERSTNVNDLSRVENQMVALHKAIREVANEHSQRTVEFNIRNGWLLFPDNNSARFEMFGTLPDAIQFNENRIVLGNESSFGPCLNSSNSLGLLGFNEPACLIQKGGGIYELDYIVLDDLDSTECHGILLDSAGNAAASKGEHKILLTYNNTQTVTSGVCATTHYTVVNVNID